MSTKFGIEWAYGEFRIARYQSGKCVEAWCAPHSVNNLNDLSEAMFEAKNHIDLSKGGDLAIAYEDDLHTHEFIEVPKLPKKDLEKHLVRRIERDKTFDGEAAYCYHPAKRGYGHGSGVLLHLMPKKIVDAVIRICEEYYLLPRRLVPLTEIMSEHVPKLGADEKDILLVVALFNKRVQLLISHGDGEILFVRELIFNLNNDSTEKLTMEINRTIGYSRQRIGPQLAKVWLIGDSAPAFFEEFKTKLHAPVEIDKSATGVAFWMTEVAELPQRISSNFIPPLARRSITRKSSMRLAVSLAILMTISSVIVAGIFETIIARRGINITKLTNSIETIDNRISKLNSELHELDEERSKLDRLTADAFNLPAVFISHLGNMAPKGLTLTQATVIRNDQAWEVELAGISKLSLINLANVLSELELKLSSDPWNMEITQSWYESWMQQLRSGSATSQSSLGFKIRGRLR